MINPLDPQAPRNVTSFCSVIVWRTPFRAYGVITGYDVMFFNPEVSGERIVILKSRDEFFHRVDMPNQRNGTAIQVKKILKVLYNIIMLALSALPLSC